MVQNFLYRCVGIRPDLKEKFETACVDKLRKFGLDEEADGIEKYIKTGEYDKILRDNSRVPPRDFRQRPY
ncbi:TPA: hypothetical protein HA244_01230 [Candidatus Micrarchaeota archaeon]|nr:hypothetical protein [Candidatus Micrarchaeota archaeon]